MVESVWVAGVDGCRDGWFVVLRKDGGMRHKLVATFRELLELEETPAVIAVDMPVGLLDCALEGGRKCDRLARKLLGKRRCCVFPPPVRNALACSTHADASKANRESSDAGLGITRQAFGIVPKLREVDQIMNARLQERILEVHPEVSFYELNGRTAVADRKKSFAGRHRRLELLEGAGFGQVIAGALAAYRRKQVARDDVLDACVACWSAGRILSGEAVRVPEAPPMDGRGLRMEIWR